MRKKEDISAYMTVEASLLFPLIVVVLLCVIYLAFYSYDKTMAFQNAGICALYGKNGMDVVENEKEWVEKMYQTLEILNNGQYIAPTNLKQLVSIEKSNIVIRQEGNVNIPLLNQNFMSKLDFIEGVKLVSKKGVFYIRQVRKVKKNEL